MKRQYDKRIHQLQGLKTGEQVWKHSNKLTLKEARPEKIQIFCNQRENQTGSISTRASRRIDHTRCFQ